MLSDVTTSKAICVANNAAQSSSRGIVTPTLLTMRVLEQTMLLVRSVAGPDVT